MQFAKNKPKSRIVVVHYWHRKPYLLIESHYVTEWCNLRKRCRVSWESGSGGDVPDFRPRAVVTETIFATISLEKHQ